VTAIQAVFGGAKKDASTDGVLDVVVVGAGISGLCIAQVLETKYAGVAPRLLVTEAKERVGGNITTVSVRPPAGSVFLELLVARTLTPGAVASAPARPPRSAHALLPARSERGRLPLGGGSEQLPGAPAAAARAAW